MFLWADTDQDHADFGATKESMNPCLDGNLVAPLITIIQVIWDHTVNPDPNYPKDTTP